MEESKLTKETIVSAALLLLNEEGLDGISLRKLGTRLGIKAPSLYWHFPDKTALLSAMIEKIFNECLDAVPGHRDWKKWMRSFGSALWKAQNATRDVGRLTTTTDIDDAHLARTHARILSRIRDLDIPEAEGMRLQSSIQAVITGWSAFAHAPYAKTLSRSVPFKAMAMQDLEAILAGHAGRRPKSSSRKATKG